MTYTTSYKAILPSAARTTSQSSGALNNNYARGILVVVDVTVNAGTAGSITVTIKGSDPNSSKTWNILASAAITAVGTTVYRVYPGLTAAGNLVASDVLPQRYQIDVTANNANPVTYSVSAMLVP